VASNLDAVFDETVLAVEYAASNSVAWTPTFFLNGAKNPEMNGF